MALEDFEKELAASQAAEIRSHGKRQRSRSRERRHGHSKVGTLSRNQWLSFISHV